MKWEGFTICNRGQRPRRLCMLCRERWGVVLCDFPLGTGHTCDLLMCRKCTHHLTNGKDFCQTHWPHYLASVQKV